MDPRYLNMTEVHLLDLSDPSVTSITTINAQQTFGGDLLLQSAVQDDVCDTFPSPYDNDYRGADDANPEAMPNRFDPDAPVFAILPDGSYALYDPRLILHENSLESPLMDGGGGVVLRSTVRAKNGFAAAQRGSSSYHYTVNDENIVLCANEYPNFVNRGMSYSARTHEVCSYYLTTLSLTLFLLDNCVLSYEENACVVADTSYIDEKQRHANVNVQVTLTFDNETLAALHR